MARIILGLGDENLNAVAKDMLEEDNVGQVVGTVLTRKTIVQRVLEKEADTVLIGELLVGETDSEDEWIHVVEELRRISLHFRIVFLCNRKENDPFLTKLVLSGVTDIFHEGYKLPAGWTVQLRDAPRYETTERFRYGHEQVTEELRKRKRKEANVPEPTPDDIVNMTYTPKPEKIIEKTVEKVVVKVKKEKETVYEQVHVPSKIIAVVSLFPGVGASSIIRMLAEELAAFHVSVGVLETASAYQSWFELINGAELLTKFPDRQDLSPTQIDTFGLLDRKDWVSWHDTLREGDIPSWGDVLHRDGVQYIVRSPRDDLSEWTETQTAQLLAYSRNVSILFCDLSGAYTETKEQIVLRSADRILVVGGYDVNRMERALPLIDTYLTPFLDKCTFVMNRSTPRMERAHSAEIKSLLDTRTLIHVPAFTSILEVYMEGESFWRSRYVREEERVQMRSVMDNLARELIGEDILHKLHHRKRGGILDRIGRFFRPDEEEVELDDNPA